MKTSPEFFKAFEDMLREADYGSAGNIIKLLKSFIAQWEKDHPEPETLDGMFEKITKWQDAIFTKATSLSCALHLKEEVEELIDAIQSESDKQGLEGADCFMLLFGFYNRSGKNVSDIISDLNAKHKINLKRKWDNKHDERGYSKHISDRLPDTGETIDHVPDAGKIGCSIRPFDCDYYQHEHLCSLPETDCQYAKHPQPSKP